MVSTTVSVKDVFGSYVVVVIGCISGISFGYRNYVRVCFSEVEAEIHFAVMGSGRPVGLSVHVGWNFSAHHS